MGRNKRGNKNKKNKKDNSNGQSKKHGSKGDSKPAVEEIKLDVEVVDATEDINDTIKSSNNKRSGSKLSATDTTQIKNYKKLIISDKDKVDEKQKDTLLDISKSVNLEENGTPFPLGTDSNNTAAKAISPPVDQESKEDCKNNESKVDNANCDVESKKTVFGSTQNKVNNAQYQLHPLSNGNDSKLDEKPNTDESRKISEVKDIKIPEKEKNSNCSTTEKEKNVSDKPKDKNNIPDEKEETRKQNPNTGYGHTYGSSYEDHSNQNKKYRPDVVNDTQLFQIPAEVSENSNKSRTLKLRFYVCLPLELWRKVRDDESKVFIYSGARKLGDWNRPLIQMENFS